MNKLIPLIALAPLAMIGCSGGDSGGGDGGGGSTTSYYNFDFVQYEKAKADTSEDCTIFASSEDEVDKYIAIIATKGFSIITHDADGSVYKSGFTANDQGQISVPKSQVPSNGYLSVVDIDQFGNNVSIFTIHKNYLDVGNYRFNVVGNVQFNDCVKTGGVTIGEQSQRFASITQPSGQGYYALRSGNLEYGDEDRIQIPVTGTAGQRFLAVSLSNNPYAPGVTSTQTTAYAFASFDTFDTDTTGGIQNPITALEVDSINLQATPPVDYSQTDAQINIYSSGAMYKWQSLNAGFLDSYGYVDRIGNTNWYIEAEGTVNGWNVNRNQQALNPQNSIDGNLGAVAPQQAILERNICSLTTSKLGVCADVSVSIDRNDYFMQRTHMRISQGTGSGSVTVRYSMYAPADARQIIVETNDSNANAALSSGNIERQEATIFSSNVRDYTSLMSLFTDEISLASRQFDKEFSDINAVVSTPQEKQTDALTLQTSDSTILSMGEDN